jgi:hypothetical protein
VVWRSAFSSLTGRWSGGTARSRAGSSPPLAALLSAFRPLPPALPDALARNNVCRLRRALLHLQHRSTGDLLRYSLLCRSATPRTAEWPVLPASIATFHPPRLNLASVAADADSGSSR